jgi:cytochrome P450
MENLTVFSPLSVPTATKSFRSSFSQTSTTSWLLSAAITFTFFVYGVLIHRNSSQGVSPKLYFGPRSTYIPNVVHNAIYAFGASTILERGYAKVCGTQLYLKHQRPNNHPQKQLKHRAYRLIRNDGNIIILPHSLLEQLSGLPTTIASPNAALERDLLGPHTGLSLILDSRLHHYIVQRKLTPKLPLITAGLEEELNAAVVDYFPKFLGQEGGAWSEFQPYQVLGKISARLAARALVGPQLCRNETWLDISVNYTESLFRTVVILRMFPAWTHTTLRYFLPSYWYGKHYVRAAKSLLGPILQDLLDRNDSGKWAPSNDGAELNVLCWLADTAKGRDRDAQTLAHVEVLLALASVHTTLLRMVNVLYDITAEPQYTTEIRDEIQQTFDADNGNWSHATYARLGKLDSVLRESQRMSPPTILGMKRLFNESFTFKDGTHVPRGAYVAMPIHAIENDPDITTNPTRFDGLRSYRLRQALLNTSNKESYLFSSPEPTVLSFGYGKSACPGRFFASLVVKMVFVKLLSEYDFRFKKGDGRPQNLLIHEFLFCWPWQWMEVKKKENGMCPF